MHENDDFLWGFQNCPSHEFQMTLTILPPADRRFGFSVMGGLDEGFPAIVDEVTIGECRFAPFPRTNRRPSEDPIKFMARGAIYLGDE